MRTDAENFGPAFELRSSMNSEMPKEDNVKLLEDCCSTARGTCMLTLQLIWMLGVKPLVLTNIGTVAASL